MGMWIETIGWISTALVLIGFALNSIQRLVPAITAWIIGDIGWIIYDIFITNYSHMFLSFIIIAINIYGIYNVSKHRVPQKD
jgi:hypothetical protein